VPTPPASPWQDEDYDVFDGDRDVGRIYVVGSYGGNETWFWGVSFQLTGRKSYGNATSLEEAKAEFRAQYERWQRERRGGVRPEARAGSRGFGKKGVAKRAASKIGAGKVAVAKKTTVRKGGQKDLSAGRPWQRNAQLQGGP